MEKKKWQQHKVRWLSNKVIREKADGLKEAHLWQVGSLGICMYINVIRDTEHS